MVVCDRGGVVEIRKVNAEKYELVVRTACAWACVLGEAQHESCLELRLEIRKDGVYPCKQYRMGLCDCKF